MSALGREIAAPVAIGRPRFRYYPGPPTAAIVSLPFLALTLFGYLTFRAKLSPGFYQFMAACTVLMIAGALVTFAIWLRMGITLSLRELGVVVNGREIPYADIDALTIYDKRRYDERAIVRAMTRTLTMHTTSGKVKALYVAVPNDASEPALDTLAAKIAEHPRPRTGKGWRIEQGTLEARRERVALSSISAAGVFERDVRLWRHHDEQHFFSVPLDSRNARVLLALTQRSARTAPAEAHVEPAPSTGMGRLLFSRRTSLISGAGNTIIAAFLLAVAGMCLERFLHVPSKLAVNVCIAGFAVWIVYSIYRATVRYHFHERALVRNSLLGSRTLAYADVAAMAWHESSTTVEHAIPLGTTVKAQLRPDDGSPVVSIRLHRFRGIDGDLERVRAAIARHIATDMQHRLAHGEEVPWTSAAKFTQEGIVVKREVLRYDRPISAFLRSGHLVLYRESWRKPIAVLPASGHNFYPGLELYEHLVQPVATEESARTSA